MKRALLLLLIVPATALAADSIPAPKLGEKADQLIRQALPVCSEEVKTTTTGLQHSLPVNLTGNVIQIESKRQVCDGQWMAAISSQGGFYIGVPWFLDEVQGPIEEKLKAYSWKLMQETFTPFVDQKSKTREGFYRVTMMETTERGKVPFYGEVDPAGTVFFFGHFMPIASDIRSERDRVFEPFMHDSPTTGASKPAVTVVEFSDFECPSCKHAAGFLKPILEKNPDTVRYVRYDLPLVAMHPWALSAAVAGRAIYHQKPDLFWTYKEQVYSNQDKLSAFNIDDFARNFALDHELDLAKYDAEIGSADLRTRMLWAVGVAFTNDVRATPTYMVNGVFVDPGNDGKALEKYIADLVKK